ncbi:MAG: DUF5916 domain-containing protein [Vicinamibacterales bacterium]
MNAALWRACGALLLALASVAPSSAQSLSVQIPRVASAPELDTFTSPEALPRPGLVSEFRQREPRDGRPATLGTTAYLSYDQDRLYAVFVCIDNPEKVRARLSRREGAEADDSVSLYLDTFHDRRRAYVFTSNPLGVQSESIKTEGQDDDDSFDTLWYSEATLTSFGYTVKMAIPFRSLRFSGELTQTWGIALSRTVQRLNEESFWPLVSKRAQGFVPQFADARGFERIAPGANLQVTPYGVFADARTGADADAAFDSTRRLGIDAKVGLGSAFVLDATVNPDFSEVESDTPQVTVNERFEVLFPEKRTFFVENAGYFATPVPTFFSRRILDPGGGARLTGKAGSWLTAGLVMNDRKTPDTDAATALVGTVRREFGRAGHIGALATMRDAAGAGNANRVVSADGRWTIGDTWAVAGQLARSDTTRSGAHTSGKAMFAALERDARHLDISAQYTDLSPDFEAALGFIRRVDVRQVDHKVSYQWRPDGGPLVKYGPTFDGYLIWNHADALTDWRTRPRFEMEFVGQTSVLVDHARSFESVGGLDFDKARSTMEVEIERAQWAIAAAYEIGTDINRKPAAGRLPHLVDRRAAEVGVSLKPGRHVALSETYLRTHLYQRGEVGGSRTVLTNDILRSKLNVHFTRALSIRAIVDYERVDPNPVFSAVKRKQPMGLDILGTLELNPGTALYVGYVDRLEPERADVPLPWNPIVRSVGRQAFVKVSWLFRY